MIRALLAVLGLAALVLAATVLLAPTPAEPPRDERAATAPPADDPVRDGRAAATAPAEDEPARAERARSRRRPRAAVDLGRPNALADPPAVTAEAGLAFEVGSGRPLWRREATTPRSMASLTKLMTGLIVARTTRHDERAVVAPAAARAIGSAVGALPVGERVSVRALMHGMLLPSGNDAAVALASHVAGSERAFVRRMNRRARVLDLGCTRFVSASGVNRGYVPLGALGNASCPRDLARLTQLALAEPRVARVAARRTARVRFGAQPVRTLTTTNPLLAAGDPGVIGLKTGTSISAGRCLIAVARRGGRRVAVVLLDSADPAGDARRLLAAAA